MSTRTIIEINHDYLHDLRTRDSFLWARLLLDLAGCELNADERQFFAAHGIRILGSRHHSNSMTLTIDGHKAHDE